MREQEVPDARGKCESAGGPQGRGEGRLPYSPPAPAIPLTWLQARVRGEPTQAGAVRCPLAPVAAHRMLLHPGEPKQGCF